MNVTGLSPNTTYQFIIRSYNHSGVTTYPNYDSIAAYGGLTSTETIVTLATAPVAKNFTDIGPNFLTANWANFPALHNPADTVYTVQISSNQ